MSKAFVLMTALPPTTGHLQLVQFANLVAEDGVVVVVNTQPHEPLAYERVAALRAAVARVGLAGPDGMAGHGDQAGRVEIRHIHRAMEQDPAAPGFWSMWEHLMIGIGVTPDDYIVASERYGRRLAEITGAQFYPYDIERALNPAKATPVRDSPLERFADILPEMQPHFRTTVTVFGAESTGKTTLSRRLAGELGGHWLFEYARPYLENTVNEITPRSMRAIWRGQAALQRQAANLPGRPFVVQDTDLFSTVGYWQFSHWQEQIGACPDELVADADALKSDLYIVTRSNIPFEKDPLRYGGDAREGSDEYWLAICERHGLPHIVLESDDPAERLREAKAAALIAAAKKAGRVTYDRRGL